MKLICPPPSRIIKCKRGNFNFIIHTFGYRKVCYPSILIKPKIFLLAQAQANTLAFKYEVNIRPPWWGWLTQIINVLIIGCFGSKTKNLNNRQKKVAWGAWKCCYQVYTKWIGFWKLGLESEWLENLNRNRPSLNGFGNWMKKFLWTLEYKFHVREIWKNVDQLQLWTSQ